MSQEWKNSHRLNRSSFRRLISRWPPSAHQCCRRRTCRTSRCSLPFVPFRLFLLIRTTPSRNWTTSYSIKSNCSWKTPRTSQSGFAKCLCTPKALYCASWAARPLADAYNFICYSIYILSHLGCCWVNDSIIIEGRLLYDSNCCSLAADCCHFLSGNLKIRSACSLGWLSII